MKKIVCELCEGTQFTKEGGFFVCHGCGTKYSLEEAKSMMREVEGEPEPFVGGAPVMAAPVGNPNQAQIDNILVLATTSYEAQNYKEAENYCNRAIELDAMAYKAWFLKGKAVGWSSTWDSPRITESSHSFCKAIDFAPEEEKEDLKNQAAEELKRLGLAHIDLCRQRFGNWPENKEYEGFGKARTELLSALTVLLAHGNAVGIPEGYLEEIATKMNQAGVAGFEKMRSAYDALTRPGNEAFNDALTMIDNCAKIIQDAINACDDDDKEDITRYENLCVIYDYTVGMSAYANGYSQYRDWSLTTQAKDLRRKQVREWKAKIEELKKTTAEKEAARKKKEEEDRKQRIAAYWEAHADEKKALEAEKEQLSKKKDTLDREIGQLTVELEDLKKKEKSKVPSEEETDKLKDQIRSLEKKRANLGMFSGKEKKQITDEIASLQGRIDSIKGKIDEEKKAKAEEIKKKLEPVQSKKDELCSERDAAAKRISAIDAEFVKDPGE